MRTLAISVGRDCSVGIAGRSAGSNPGWTRLSAPVQTGHDDYPICCAVRTGDKAAAAWCSPPTPSRAGVKERVELYVTPPGASWPVIGGTVLPYLYISSILGVLILLVGKVPLKIPLEFV